MSDQPDREKRRYLALFALGMSLIALGITQDNGSPAFTGAGLIFMFAGAVRMKKERDKNK